MAASTLRVASIPFVSRDGDNAHNAARIAALLGDAAREGVALAVFPEKSLSGYANTAKLPRAQLDALAEPLDGASVRTVAAAVDRTGVACGVGLIERAPDGRLFNSYAVCLPGGERHCHRQLHAAGHRRIGNGDAFTVFDTAWGIRVAILIGSDSYPVENVRMTALMDATLLVAAHRRERGRVGDDGLDAAALSARAADNGMFVAFAEGVDSDDRSDAAAMIVDPSGHVLATCASHTEGVGAVADVDMTLAGGSRGRRWLAARRPDLYGPLAQQQQHPSNGRALLPESPRAVAKGAVAVSFAVVGRNRLRL
ncbi:nitrilase-related carbon-nitrogen hydrolase [Paraburkholderia flava]|uniref:nitrilase-related carbon-nitrogen hydrolase n=1 Tax=Paraburkholderia flava TaxID=2547393 RepID=UPI001F0E2B0B|nr:nitrilase-related carbon-nitrogen hydrolase [Paraburkholderia flava]